jgi:serine/threonine protein kinase
MQVGRYRFVDRMAVGGMAEVFVAIAEGSQGFQKPVVIKRLLPQLAAIPRFRQMFLDEARITANLQHGNIVQVLDMGSMQGLPFLALEWVDGRDLRTVHYRTKDAGKTIPFGLVAYVASEVCRALDYAHRKRDDAGRPLNIVHRDINPANIYLSHEGVVKVGDFGLAKARDNLEQSEVGLIKGKFSYMSPEQTLGQAVDHRSDVFSLGTTIYELTCGRLPFTGASDPDVVERVRETLFTPPSQVVESYDLQLEAIVLRAMERDPDDRYATANEMRDDLSRYLQQLPSPVGDRQMTEFLDGLFAKERRSRSNLVRLPSLTTLPPTMTPVSRRPDGLAEFKPGEAGPPPLPPSEPRSGEPTPRPVVPDPQGSSSARTRSPMVWLLAALILAAGVGGTWLFVVLRRPAGATLRLISNPPGARVMIDGKFIGERTPATLSNLAVNQDHLVAVYHPEAKSAERHFRFHAPGDYGHSFELQPRTEALRVESTPNAVDVLVDGKLRGQTPLLLTLEYGEHALVLRKSGYLTKTIDHRANREQAALSIALDRQERDEPEPEPEAEPEPPRPKPKPSVKRPRIKQPRIKRPPVAPTIPGQASGWLELDTGKQTKVFIDGRFAGRTPGFRKQLPPGRYVIRVEPLHGKLAHQATVEIRSGTTQRLRLTPPSP